MTQTTTIQTNAVPRTPPSQTTTTRPSLAVQGGPVPLVVDVAVAAERHGFDAVWTTEFYNRSAIVTLAAIAAATTRLRIGSGIAWAFGRTPVTLATDVRSIDDLSAGRLVLGIGTGNPMVISDWHGLTEPHPVPRLKELAGLLREIWQLHEKPVAHDDRFYRCHLPLDPHLPPLAQGTIPILFAGGRPAMVRAAGATADGLVGHPLSTRSYVEEVIRPALAEGARRAGRTDPVPVSGMIICAVGDDAAEARTAVATQVAVYATRSSSDSVLTFHGFDEETSEIRSAFARRDMSGMVGAVSERMLDVLTVYGTPEEARQRYTARFDGLYETPLFYSPETTLPVEYLRDNLHAICETFAPPRPEDRREA